MVISIKTGKILFIGLLLIINSKRFMLAPLNRVVYATPFKLGSFD